LLFQITSDDIKKTYGGSRSYYNSGYSPSTSAYMLMYRQIDKERNTEVLKLEEFPEHIKVQFMRNYLVKIRLNKIKILINCN